MAIKQIDYGRGANQAFTAGYSSRIFADQFHDQTTYEAAETYRDAYESYERIKKLSEWKWIRGLGFSTTYDSNVFASRQDPLNDTLFSYNPLIGVSRNEKFLSFLVLYQPAYIQYQKNVQLSRWNHEMTTDVGLHLQRLKRLKVKVKNSFKPDTTYEVGERGELKSPGSSQVTTYSDNGEIKAIYDVSSKTQLLLTYNASLYYFPAKSNSGSSSIQSFSSLTQSWTPSVSYRILPKTSVHADYLYQTSEYLKGGRFGSQNSMITVGIAGPMSGKTAYTVDVGFSERTYDDATIPTANGLNLKTAISRKFTPKISGTLAYTRDINEDFDQTQSQSFQRSTDFYSVNATWLFRPRVRVDGQASIVVNSKEGFITLADTENPKLLFTREEEDVIYQYGVDVIWKPSKAWSVSVSYRYFNKNSSFKTFEYDRQTVLGTVGMTF